ncbi:MAG TPA: hypothetical protein PLV42_08755 [bacterium]|nr:hypothetical protein [bacterium]
MKFALAVFAVLLLLAACDEFKEAPLSKCITNPATALLLEEEENPCQSRAILVSRTEDKLVIDYQQLFVCAGIKYGYIAHVDEADPTILIIEITSESGDSVATCVCCKRMTVTYKAAAEKIAKITQVKVSGDDWELPSLLPIETP